MRRPQQSRPLGRWRLPLRGGHHPLPNNGAGCHIQVVEPSKGRIGWPRCLCTNGKERRPSTRHIKWPPCGSSGPALQSGGEPLPSAGALQGRGGTVILLPGTGGSNQKLLGYPVQKLKDCWKPRHVGPESAHQDQHQLLGLNPVEAQCEWMLMYTVGVQEWNSRRENRPASL